MGRKQAIVATKEGSIGDFDWEETKKFRVCGEWYKEYTLCDWMSEHKIADGDEIGKDVLVALINQWNEYTDEYKDGQEKAAVMALGYIALGYRIFFADA